MFGLHMPELIIIMVIALLIFGPKKLPEMGSSLGKTITAFRKSMNEISQPKEDTPPTEPKAIESQVLPRRETPTMLESEAAPKPNSEAGQAEVPAE